MPSADEKFKRNGVGTIMAIAKTACRIVSLYGPRAKLAYSDIPVIVALIVALEGICPLLPPADAAYKASRTSGVNASYTPPPPATP